MQSVKKRSFGKGCYIGKKKSESIAKQAITLGWPTDKSSIEVNDSFRRPVQTERDDRIGIYFATDGHSDENPLFDAEYSSVYDVPSKPFNCPTIFRL